MRVYMVADSHFGMRSNSPEWLDIAAGWFENHFVPALRAEVRPGDVMVHLGDVFDNRQSLNLLVLHRGISVFETLSDVFKGGEVHVIAGNHDVMKRNSNEVCSLDCLKWIPRVLVHKKPSVIQLGGASALLMPWLPGPGEEQECLRKHGNVDYVFCHTNFLGMRLDGHHTVDEAALSVEDLRPFKRVFSGHIHLRQDLRNVHMLGNPYQMTRSDGGNRKGWHVLDVPTDSLRFVENEVSPAFKRVHLPQWNDRPLDELLEECKGHMVDLYVPNSWFVKGYAVSAVSAAVSEVTRSLDVVPYDEGRTDEPPPLDAGSQFSMMDMCRRYVGGMGSIDAPTREKVVRKLEELYKQTADL